MIKVRKKKDLLNVKLEGECLIDTVEEAYNKLKNSMSNPEITQIALDTKGLESIDTSYLQLIISLVKSVKEQGMKLNIKAESEILNEILELYGINRLFN